MATAQRTRDHDQIRQWAEQRGGIPAYVKGTEGLLRIDFVEGKGSHGREDKLEEVSWDDWFEVFDDRGLSFLHSDDDSRFFKLVEAEDDEESEEEDEDADADEDEDEDIDEDEDDEDELDEEDEVDEDDEPDTGKGGKSAASKRKR
jgi:hypothetical protein